MNQHLFLRAIEINKPQNLKTFPFCLPTINQLEKMIFNKKVTFFVGENGAGKSTLLEGIAVSMGFNPEGGSRGLQFSTQDSHSLLHEYIRPIRGASRMKDGYFLRSESFYNLSTAIDEVGAVEFYGDESLHEKSHGEGIMALFSNRLYGKGLYIFDEPESGLSPVSLFTLLRMIHALTEDDSQFIIATHSPLLLAYPNAEIYEFKDSSITAISYKDSEIYNLYKRVLDDSTFISNLIED